MIDSQNDELKPKRVRGIYLLPNLFTIGAMFAGFYAIIAGLQGRYENAVVAIFIAIVLDGLDGRVARWTHSQSEIGAQLDSLSDMVFSGIAPAMVTYSWSISVLGKPGWLVAFVYTMCTGLRLARFNALAQSDDKHYFHGLPTPAASALVASTIWMFSVNQINGVSMASVMALMLFLLALLKVSSIQYRSFKDFDLRNRVSLVFILALILILVLIALDPPRTLFFVTLVYVLSGPLGMVWRFFRKRCHAKK